MLARPADEAHGALSRLAPARCFASSDDFREVLGVGTLKRVLVIVLCAVAVAGLAVSGWFAYDARRQAKTIRRDIASLSSEVSSVESTVDDLSGSVDNVQSSVDDVSSRIEDVASALDDVSSTLSGLCLELNAAC
jgi:septal ring factor EnvC (AmiA/AmiB activator)